jgi:hypothetical protein
MERELGTAVDCTVGLNIPEDFSVVNGKMFSLKITSLEI